MGAVGEGSTYSSVGSRDLKRISKSPKTIKALRGALGCISDVDEQFVPVLLNHRLADPVPLAKPQSYGLGLGLGLGLAHSNLDRRLPREVGRLLISLVPLGNVELGPEELVYSPEA